MPRKALDLVKYHYQNLTYDHKHLPWLLVLFIFVNIFALSIGSFLPSGGSYFGVNVGVARAEADDGSTVLLIHSDTTNGSTTFVDSSTGGTTHIITANGDVAHATLGKIGGGFGTFDGVGDYISVADSDDFNFGSGDFTIDSWVKTTSTSGWLVIASQYDGASNEASLFAISSGDYLGFYASNDGGGSPWYDVGMDIQVPGINNGAWHHVALVRTGDTIKFFVDGVQKLSQGLPASYSIYNSTADFTIGSQGIWNSFDGQMDEVRVSKGVARWTTGFTPETSEYSSDANTQLLLHMDGDGQAFVDSGNTGHVLVANDNVTQVGPKFGSSLMYFDGTGDYLSIPDSEDWNFGSGNFTIDFWYKTNKLVSDFERILGQTDATPTQLQTFYKQTSIMRYYFNKTSGANEVALGTVPNTDWNHYAVVRNGNTFTGYINGVAGTPITDSGTLANISGVFGVGRSGGYDQPSSYMNGYIDEIRISKGIARWTSNFTPPTAPYSVSTVPVVTTGIDSSARLVLHGDGVGASFVDNSDGAHTITPSGNATQSATQSKFGGKSMYFDGSGDYLSISDSDDWDFGSGDFTIDTWIWTNATDKDTNGWYREIFSKAGYLNSNMLLLHLNDATGKLRVTIGNNTNYLGTAVINNSNWHHVAFVRNSGISKVYVDGILDIAGFTDTTNYGTNAYGFNVGTTYDITNSLYKGWWKGYIDEMRVSKGIARWTSNFTPPSAPYASVSISGNTVVGQTLTATYNYTDAENDPEGASLYQWYRADTADGTYSAISGATNLTYTLGVNDYDKYIKYEVTPVSSIAPTTGSVVTSSAIGPIALNSVAPVATNVSVSGNILVGQKLTGSYTYSDAEGDAEGVSAFRWLRADTAGGTYVAISGATGLTYTLVSADNGKYIKFEVTPKAVNVPTNGVVVLSSATSQITATPVANLAPQVSAVNVSGSKLIGSVLTGNYVYSDYENDSQGASTFRWLRSDTIDGTYAPISEATGVTYSLTSADENKYIKFEVTPRSTTGTLVGVLTLSAAFGKVYSPLVVQQSFTQSTSTTIAIANTSVVGTATMPTSTIVIELKADQKLEFNDAVSAGVSAVNTTVTTPAGNVSIQAAMAEIMGSAFTETEVDSVQLNSGVAGEAIVISQGGMQVEIADATEIYAPASWDGTIQPPKVEQVTIPGKTTTSVISMGAPGISLVFTKPAKIVVPSSVGGPSYTVDGTNWINITTQCNTENGGGFSFPGECYYKSGQNTIIWTYHFTQFGMGSANLGLEFFNSYTGGISTTTVIGGDLEANGTSTLRILKGGVVYHLPVVATSSPYASSWRILVDGVVRAVKMFGWRTD